MEKFRLEKEAESIEMEVPSEIPVLNPVNSTFNYEVQHSHLGMDTVQSKSSKAQEAEIEQAAHLSSGQSPSAPLGTISNKTGAILTNKVMEKDMTQFQKGSLIDISENGADLNNNLFRLDVESTDLRNMKGITHKPVIMSSREFPQKSGIIIRNSKNELGVVNMIDLQEDILPRQKAVLVEAFAVLVHDIVADFPKVKAEMQDPISLSPEIINFGDEFQQKQDNQGEFQKSSMLLFSEKDQISGQIVDQQNEDQNQNSQVLSFNMQASRVDLRPEIKDQMESMHEKSQKNTLEESQRESNLIESARNDMQMHFEQEQQIGQMKFNEPSQQDQMNVSNNQLSQEESVQNENEEEEDTVTLTSNDSAKFERRQLQRQLLQLAKVDTSAGENTQIQIVQQQAPAIISNKDLDDLDVGRFVKKVESQKTNLQMGSGMINTNAGEYSLMDPSFNQFQNGVFNNHGDQRSGEISNQLNNQNFQSMAQSANKQNNNVINQDFFTVSEGERSGQNSPANNTSIEQQRLIGVDQYKSSSDRHDTDNEGEPLNNDGTPEHEQQPRLANQVSQTNNANETDQNIQQSSLNIPQNNDTENAAGQPSPRNSQLLAPLQGSNQQIETSLKKRKDSASLGGAAMVPGDNAIVPFNLDAQAQNGLQDDVEALPAVNDSSANLINLDNVDNQIQIQNVDQILPQNTAINKITEVKLKKEISQNPSVGQIVPQPTQQQEQEVELTQLIQKNPVAVPEKNKIPVKPKPVITGAGGNFQNPMMMGIGGVGRFGDKKKESTDPAIEAELKAFNKNQPQKKLNNLDDSTSKFKKKTNVAQDNLAVPPSGKSEMPGAPKGLGAKKGDVSGDGGEDPNKTAGAGEPAPDDKKEQEEEENQQLSYKGLVKFISLHHPVNPISKEKFSVFQRITVRDYGFKMTDACGFYTICLVCKSCVKRYTKLQRFEEKRVKPSSMNDLPDSASESSGDEDEGGFGGLTSAGAHLGIGAVLYLQIMKTFAILFFFLTILNLPVYALYASNTLNNDYQHFLSGYPFFSLGNLAMVNPECSTTKELFTKPEASFDIKCTMDEQYITTVQYFGFLYEIDPKTEKHSDGVKTCKKIMGIEIPKEPEQPKKRMLTFDDDFEDQRQLLELPQSSSSQETPEIKSQQTPNDDGTENTNVGNKGPDSAVKKAQDPQETQEEEGGEAAGGILGGGEASAQKPGEEPEEEKDLDINEEVKNVSADQLKEVEQTIDSMVSKDQQNKTSFNIDSECNHGSKELFKNDDARSRFDQLLIDKCLQKTSCQLSMKELDFENNISDFCKERIMSDNSTKRWTSHSFILVVGCKGDSVQLFGSNDGKTQPTMLHKEEVGCIVVCFDILGMLLMVFMFYKIEQLNKEYLTTVDDNQITMKDFAVMCTNVKLDRYTQDSRLIKMKIWLHFTELMAPFRIYGNDQEVVDVTLSLSTQPKMIQIFKMEQTQQQISVIKSKINAGEYKDAEFFQKQEELEDLQEMYDRQKERYKMIAEEDKKEQKNVGIKSKSNRIEMIDYIFVTFKNNESIEQTTDVFEKESGASKFFRCLFCIKSKQQQKKEFLKQELTVEESIEPDEIIWENLSFTAGTTGGRKLIMNGMSVATLLFSALIAIAMEGQKEYIATKFPPLDCPDKPIDKPDAYEDVISGKPIGLMPCYCEQQMQKQPWLVPTMQFDDKDTKYYCEEYVVESGYTTAMKAVAASSVITLNGVIAKVFKRLGEYQMKHTTIETTQTAFNQIFIMEFFNTGVIILLISFAGMTNAFAGDTEGSAAISSKKSRYDGFEPSWYKDIGIVINASLILSCFVSNSIDMKKFANKTWAQLKDRGFKDNLKKYPDDEDDDEPNTKILTQQDLTLLYEGEDFECEKTLSRMMSTVFVVLCYSSGMPMLYMIGFVFFSITFLVNKVLLIKYYKRTDSILSRTIPLYSVHILKYAVLMKMVIGIFMFTQPDVFETKDGPNEERYAWNDGKIPRLFDISELINSAQSFAEGGNEQQEDDPAEKVLDGFNIAKYFQYLHQQLFILFVVGFIFCIVFGQFTFNLIRIILVKIKDGIVSTVAKIVYTLRFISAYIQALVNKCYQKLLKCTKAIKKRMKKNKNRDSDTKEEDDKDGKGVHQKLTEESAEVQKKDETSSLNASEAASSVNQNQDATEEASKKLKEQERIAYMEEVRKKRLNKPDYSDNFFKELNIENLDSFYQRSQREYEDFKAYFKINEQNKKHMFNSEAKRPHPIRVDFLELCYMSGVIEENVKTYDELLFKRIQDIEAVIDVHFELIKDVIFEEKEEKRDRDIEKTFSKEDYRQKIDQMIIEAKFKNDPDLKFEDPKIYTYTKKLQQLTNHQDALIKQDKERLDNRRKMQTICRMKGSLTQSFFIFDSQRFKMARKIFYNLENEEDEMRHQQELEEIIESEYDSEEESSSSSGSEKRGK